MNFSILEYSNSLRAFLERYSGLASQHNEKWETFLGSHPQSDLSSYLEEITRFDWESKDLPKVSSALQSFLQKIYHFLNISETYFYRDPEQLDTIIEDVVVPQIASYPKKHFKVWSAGCSRGEEVYTLAILLQNLKLSRFPTFSFEVFGTDIQSKSIEWAKLGRYEKYSVRADLPNSFLRFLDMSSGKVEVSPEIRNLVRFEVRNLLEKPNDYQHMIVCRNVLIYVTESQKSQILENFQKALVPGGILLTGHSELSSLVPPYFRIFHIPKKTSYYLSLPATEIENSDMAMEGEKRPKPKEEDTKIPTKFEFDGERMEKSYEEEVVLIESADRYMEQIQKWKELIYMDPEHLEAYYELSSLYWEMGERSQAKTYQSRAQVLIKNDPQIVDIWKSTKGWKQEWEAFFNETL
ncbi:hypothetical protein LPTSP4_00080 [Leptospira ryugenii]|uniref:CheR-type methyltransferase domain-containing protein n=1 Tax=Leptospira ryugenii TaxID=1917863 RepID=A0A2P2DV48_9LEPT|nr:CheR family methyltransferase [Leptospira ryugenii]GBF48509.1 hypothetical protein LPTSP4_00080 [Leptospira ryugenii]